MNKNKIIIYLCTLIFGAVSIYLLFVAGNTNKYDSQTKAYKIDPNEYYDSEDKIIYNPIYYFEVDGNNYECEAKGTSSYPKKNKNTVYYDSSNPTKCKTEYEKSTSKFAGIICLIAKRLENAGDASQTVVFLTVILRRVIAKAQVKYVL